MHIRILGSAAGGGVPQWNCRCPNCAAAWDGSPAVQPRTQSSVAVSADGRAWFLLNVSPDVRQQILAFPELGPPEGQQRGTAIAGCVLTDAELDHTAGLLILREEPPLSLFGTPVVHRWLSSSNLIHMFLTLIPRSWTKLPLYEFIDLTLPDGSPSGLRVQAFPLGDHVPRFIPEQGQLGSVVGLLVQNKKTGGRLVYAPGVEEISPGLKSAAQGADCILIDGTFWDDDEPLRFGIGQRSAREMGHLPVSGPEGSLDWLSGLKAPHRVYVHINNTNPMLNECGPGYRRVSECGVRVGADGDHFEL
ncbi:MAG: pyrroloquinoline quinone biosynthesis protein PqqB [Planctomycetes bacterium]|nr:pyrroloquinoline quinone biosynthesis protein PqqB [Planctomycetota bacterium]